MKRVRGQIAGSVTIAAKKAFCQIYGRINQFPRSIRFARASRPLGDLLQRSLRPTANTPLPPPDRVPKLAARGAAAVLEFVKFRALA
jgi:hypothetical protein